MISLLWTCYPLYHYTSCLPTSGNLYTVLNYYQHLYNRRHVAVLQLSALAWHLFCLGTGAIYAGFHTEWLALHTQ